MHGRTVVLFLTASTISASLALAMSAAGCGSSSSTSNDAGARDSGAMGADSGTTMPDSGATMMEAGAVEASAQDSGAPETGMAMTCTMPDGGFPAGYPATHAPFPTVPYNGGGVLVQPEAVTITFQGDTLAPQLEQFGDQIMQSCYWDSVRAGYCEGAGGPCIGRGVVPATPHVELPMPANATYTGQGIDSFVQAEVASGAFPPPDPGTIYAMYFPGSTTITSGSGKSCSNFLGYHSSVSVTPPGGTATNVAYAVIDECPGGSLLDGTTRTASHEFIEAATDPFVGSGGYGYIMDFNEDNLGWLYFSVAGEVGDLCDDLLSFFEGNSPQDVFQATTASSSFAVQRIWSIGAATAGGDPCVPIGPGNAPYFNLAIAAGQQTQVLSVGQQVTFEADAFSTGPVSWTVGSIDWTSITTGASSAISVSIQTPDAGTVTNGDALMVTVKLNSMPTTQIAQGTNGSVFLLLSQSGSTLHYWPGAIIAQ